MTHDEAMKIIDRTGALQGEKFRTPTEVREYMKPGNIVDMFGECDIPEETLEAVADYMIEYRMGMR